MAVAVAHPPRPLKGSRQADFYPPIPEAGPSLSACDSAFQLQEYIAMLIRHNPHDVEKIVNIPSNARVVNSEERNDETGDKDGKTEVVVDEACWIYEHLRRLAQDLSHPLITSLQLECNRTTCPEMKAGEWLYLCVAHGNDGAMEHCCAIDYIIHTLDSATALLNSPRAFPSRLSIPSASLRHFSSLARRLGRIFAHAYFHHREAFEAAEAETSLYARFLALTMRFSLVPAEFLAIPPRMANLVPGAQTSGLSVERENERGVDRHLEPKANMDQPRLLNPSVTIQQRQEPQASDRPSQVPEEHEVIDISAESIERERSPEKPSAVGGTGAQDSPRKLGRSRTDTMVHSDFMAFSEELKGAVGAGSGLGINFPTPEPGSGKDDEREEQEDLRSGWDEVSLEADTEGRGAEDESVEYIHEDEETDQAPPEADIDSDPLASSTQVHEENAQPLEPDTETEPAPTEETSATVSEHEQISAPTVSAEANDDEKPELLLLSKSKDICEPIAPVEPVEPIALATQDQSSKDENEDEDVPLAESEPIGSALKDILGTSVDDNIGPGGFIMLGEPGDMCKIGGGSTCEEKADEPGNAEVAQSEVVEEVAVKEIEETSVEEEKKGETAAASGDAEVEANTATKVGNTTLGNVTLEEDLQDVEKVLESEQ